MSPTARTSAGWALRHSSWPARRPCAGSRISSRPCCRAKQRLPNTRHRTRSTPRPSCPSPSARSRLPMLLKDRRKHARPRAGDWVEVKSAEEILATLDEQGRLEGLPFMPEMLQYCGKRLQVFKSAHKSCDTIQDWKTMRSMRGAVHLAGVRCDGASHGGCQAACLLYWKEAWLKPVGDPTVAPTGTPRCDEAALVAATHAGEGSEARYRCQATDLPAATTPIARWSVGHYVADL